MAKPKFSSDEKLLITAIEEKYSEITAQTDVVAAAREAHRREARKLLTLKNELVSICAPAPLFTEESA